jgi:YbgC/YbaW family acyl-CoA thioester hydrolase
MKFKYKKRVYGYECDVYGHLNNAVYLQIFEAARSEAIIEMGLPLSELKKDSIMMFVVRVEVDYKRGILHEDDIEVQSRILKHDKLSALWCQEIYDSANNLCSIANIKIVYVKNYKPTRITTEMYELFDRFYDEDRG